MNGDVLEIHDLKLELAESDVWSCLGARNKVFPELRDDVISGIALAKELCVPRGLLRRLPVAQIGRDAVSFVDGPVLGGKFMAHLFEGAREAAFLVLTVGPALEAKVAERFADGDTVEAFVLDAVGTASVMSFLTRVLGQISQETKSRGWHAGTCLSPGQSYWDVTGQESIFQVMPTERIEVELLESSFIRPQKSHSAVVPVGPELKVHGDPNESYCRYCQATRCPLRTEPYSVPAV